MKRRGGFRQTSLKKELMNIHSRLADIEDDDPIKIQNILEKERDKMLSMMVCKLQTTNDINRHAPLEIRWIIQHFNRTVKIERQIKDMAVRICKLDNCCTDKKNPCFFTDMSMYKTGVPARTLKTCIFLMLEDSDFKKGAQSAQGFLHMNHKSSEAGIAALTADQYASRLETLPNKAVVYALLNELSFYFSWCRLMAQNPRRFARLACRLMPPYLSMKDGLLGKYMQFAPTMARDEEFRFLVDSCGVPFYQKAFMGRYGLYSLFYMFMDLVLRSLAPILSHTKMDHWLFDIDVRRPFIEMGKKFNFKAEMYCTSAMPLVWFYSDDPDCTSHIPPDQDKMCVCGNPGTDPFYIVIGDYAQPLDLTFSIYKQKDKKFVLRYYCEKKMCYLNDFAPMHASFMEAMQVFKNGGKLKSKMEEAKWSLAIKQMPVSTVRVDFEALMKMSKGIYEKKRAWSDPEHARSMGFDWNEWPNTLKNENVRFCWACMKYGHRLHLCSSCRKARYCNKRCLHRHWEDHKEFCIFQKAKRLIRNIEKEEIQNKEKDVPIKSSKSQKFDDFELD